MEHFNKKVRSWSQYKIHDFKRCYAIDVIDQYGFGFWFKMYTSTNAAPDQLTTKIKFHSPCTQNLLIIFSLFKPGGNDGKVDMIWTFLNIRLKAEPAQMCFGELIYIYLNQQVLYFNWRLAILMAERYYREINNHNTHIASLIKASSSRSANSVHINMSSVVRYYRIGIAHH